VTLAFTLSPDDASVSAYALEIFPATAEISTASPAYVLGIGKPGADASGNATVDITTFFDGLPAGSYQVAVSATWSGGSVRSEPFSVTR
jgi:hypothetical protein